MTGERRLSSLSMVKREVVPNVDLLRRSVAARTGTFSSVMLFSLPPAKRSFPRRVPPRFKVRLEPVLAIGGREGATGEDNSLGASL